jgi:PhoH-like ATPase
MLQITDLTVSPQFVDQMYSEGTVKKNAPSNIPVNSYVLFRDETNPKHTALARYLGDNTWQRIASNSSLQTQGISPKDAYQCAFVDALKAPGTLLNVATGAAGTGKTLLAMAHAIDQWMTTRKKIILSKPTSMVGSGSAFGPVPGDIEQKYAPYLASYDIVLKKVLGDSYTGFVNSAMKNGDIEFVPIELSRGCTYENATFILDEAQNLSWHELNTIVSRMGQGTNLIILGDLNQIDTDSYKTDTGLWKFLRSTPFNKSNITSSIQLKTQYRSPITQLVSDVNDWIIEDAKQARNSRRDLPATNSTSDEG